MYGLDVRRKNIGGRDPCVLEFIAPNGIGSFISASVLENNGKYLEPCRVNRQATPFRDGSHRRLSL